MSDAASIILLVGGISIFILSLLNARQYFRLRRTVRSIGQGDSPSTVHADAPQEIGVAIRTIEMKLDKLTDSTQDLGNGMKRLEHGEREIREELARLRQ
jgi:hypothetical protein